MTLQEVILKIKHIEEIKGDDEAAHSNEDDLYFEFIKFIADGNYSELSTLAKEVIKTKDIEFSRWCA